MGHVGHLGRTGAVIDDACLGWDDLSRELDRWGEASRSAPLWWRDDDAADTGPALSRMLALADAHALPLALAVLPAGATWPLAETVLPYGRAAVIQHGFAHRNHAAAGERAVEVGGARPVATVLDELFEGFGRLQDLFGPRFRPVLAPPWNRIAPQLLPHLPGAGYRGLSAFGPRAAIGPAAGLVVANAHVDPLSWRGGPRFAGTAKVLRLIVEALQARREVADPAAEPVGVLTHHLDHDPEAWAFIERLMDVTAAHPAARWLSVDEVFALRLPHAQTGP